MYQERERELAKKLVRYSCQVKPGEKVLIEYSATSDSFLRCLVEEVFRAKAFPFVHHINKAVTSRVLEKGSKELFELMGKYDAYRMQDMDAVILIRGENNMFEYSRIPQKNVIDYNNTYYKVVHMERRLNKKWVNMSFPTPAFAQSAGVSTSEFTDFYFDVCNLDYGKIKKALKPLKGLMEKTDRVRIVAKDTNLEFSIKGIPAVKCCGEKNIPDGEIYTAPIKNSVNGFIKFNVPAMYNGIMHTDIKLVFKDGEIVSASSNNTKELLNIINTDGGSRYLGEFSFGVNPHMTSPINSILFDEKMRYSIHFAIGNAYDDAFNGNKSSVHWDLIQLQSKNYGGGEIYFDDVLIRKNGVFTLPNLIALNPENLV